MATKKTSKKDPLKSKSEWTITEFQMWLHGAYSLQGEDWVPTAEQWEMIVDIIYKLKDRKVAQRPVAPPMMPPMLPPQPDGYNGGMIGPPTAGSALDSVEVPDEANMSLSELKRRREGGAANGNVLAGGGPPGEKTIKTGSFE